MAANFSLSPGMATNDVIDYTTTTGQKVWEKMTAKLSDEFSKEASSTASQQQMPGPAQSGMQSSNKSGSSKLTVSTDDDSSSQTSIPNTKRIQGSSSTANISSASNINKDKALTVT
jgi:hypothetical protein